MKEVYHIIEELLPIPQDYTSLKNEGLAFIQEFGGTAWTNLNPSDPGVTILDQVCYALTELGYCNDFPVADILTGPNKELKIKNQFYLPEEILTTSPITIEDYQKYIINGIESVLNTVITPIKNTLSPINGVYRVYLLIDQRIQDPVEIKTICEATFFLLNSSRNLGELFLMPAPLKPKEVLVSGTIHITKGDATYAFLKTFNEVVNNFIFSRIQQTGYDELINDGLDINAIFNGPNLQHGWIKTSDLSPKHDQVQIFEIQNILLALENIKSITTLGFLKKKNEEEKIKNSVSNTPEIAQPEKSKTRKKVKAKEHEVLVINLIESVVNGNLEIVHNGRNLFGKATSSLQDLIKSSPKSKIQIPAVGSISLYPKLPKGKYRDINAYYSIQNTFPEIYAVGADAPLKHASKTKTAQSRQLKGYLTLFDQVLANQFSQLANIDQLFSFRNSLIGNPSDSAKFYEVKDRFEKQHLEYPAPYISFSPTYFFQSLYEIPYIQPLLKDKDVFRFSSRTKSETALDEIGWEGYKSLPYNAYIRGLMEFMEDEKTNLNRRNEILDHLLARHGESPLFIDSIIEDSIYSANRLKDRVIFKSLYLQNFGMLSYYRQKASNFIGARTIATKPAKTTDEFLKNLQHELKIDYTKDFIFNVHEIDEIEKLNPQDFINHSAIVLKLSLLLGLRFQYHSYILECYKNKADDQQIQQALWMIQKQKGIILLETNVLLQFAEFVVGFSQNTTKGISWRLQKVLSYTELIAIDLKLRKNPQKRLTHWTQTGTLKIGDISYTLTKWDSNAKTVRIYTPIPDSEFSLSIKAKWKNGTEFYLNNSGFNNSVALIFPHFISEFTTPSFENRIQLFCENTLPVQLDFSYHTLEKDVLGHFITAYTNWHDSLIYSYEKDRSYLDQLKSPAVLKNAGILAERLIEQLKLKRLNDE